MKVLMVLIAAVVLASPLAEGKSKRKKRIVKVKDNHNFEDMHIKGKYQFPFESRVGVEDDKFLQDLLVLRKDFKDRIKRSESRR